MTFGFHTAVQIATDAIDRLHTTAESHDRVMVVEVMGRHSGWIATYAGIAGGASVVLIPEIPFDIDEVVRRTSTGATSRGRYASIVVVAEGAEPMPGTLDVGERVYDKFGHVRLGGIADVIAREIGRAHRLRDPRRDARPRAARRHADGVRPRAVDALRRRRRSTSCTTRAWGQMVVLRGTEIVPAPLDARRRQDPPRRHGAVPRRRRGLLRLTRAGGSPASRPAASSGRSRPPAWRWRTTAVGGRRGAVVVIVVRGLRRRRSGTAGCDDSASRGSRRSSAASTGCAPAPSGHASVGAVDAEAHGSVAARARWR